MKLCISTHLYFIITITISQIANKRFLFIKLLRCLPLFMSHNSCNLLYLLRQTCVCARVSKKYVWIDIKKILKISCILLCNRNRIYWNALFSECKSPCAVYWLIVNDSIIKCFWNYICVNTHMNSKAGFINCHHQSKQLNQQNDLLNQFVISVLYRLIIKLNQ